VCEPIFAKPLSEISFGTVLMQLFQTVRRFEMPVQPQLVLLYKTLLNIEGLGRQLYPDLNLWDTAKPFLENWMKQQMSPQALIDDFKRDWPKWRALLPQLPQLVQRLAEEKQPNAAPSKASKLGVGVTALGAIASLLGHYDFLDNSFINSISPWVVVAGIVLILIRR